MSAAVFDCDVSERIRRMTNALCSLSRGGKAKHEEEKKHNQGNRTR